MRKTIKQGASPCPKLHKEIEFVHTIDRNGESDKSHRDWLLARISRAKQAKPIRLRSVHQDLIEAKLIGWLSEAGIYTDFISDAWLVYNDVVTWADIYFPCGLILEVDGPLHERENEMRKDDIKEFSGQWPLGLFVLRVTTIDLNHDKGILRFKDQVIELLRDCLKRTKSHLAMLRKRVSRHRQKLESILGDDAPWVRDPYRDECKVILPDNHPFRTFYGRKRHRIRSKVKIQTTNGHQLEIQLEGKCFVKVMNCRKQKARTSRN